MISRSSLIQCKSNKKESKLKLVLFKNILTLASGRSLQGLNGLALAFLENGFESKLSQPKSDSNWK